MNQESFSIERTYHAPVQKVWEAITNREQMKQWYFDIPDFRPEEGNEFSFTGKDHDGKEWIHLCRVLEVIPMKKLVHSWRYQGYEGDTQVTWELFAEGENTRVKLTHTGFETLPALRSLAKENFEQGWTEIVGSSLKKFVEKERQAAATS